MVLKDEWFKHFRIFLKTNGLYNEFMECFKNQKYGSMHSLEGEHRPNYIKVMRKDDYAMYTYEEFNAMVFTFASFTWVKFDCNIPYEFTIKWCTVGFKWGLYCLKHNIEICSLSRFLYLYRYWDGEKWLDYSLITDEEKQILEEAKDKEGSERD